MRWTNDAPADLARLTAMLWRAVLVAGRLMIVGLALLAGWMRWAGARGQITPTTQEALLPVLVILSLVLALSWPYLFLPVAPRRLLRIEDGYVVGETVLGTRRVTVDGLTLYSHWFPLTKPSFDGVVYLLRDPRGRILLLLDGYPDRSPDGATVGDAERSIAADASERPPLGPLIERELLRPTTWRERLQGWLALTGVVAVGFCLAYLLIRIALP